jgi:hypothetical protein
MKNDEEIFDDLIDEVNQMSDKDFQLLSEEADIFLNKEKEIYKKVGCGYCYDCSGYEYCKNRKHMCKKAKNYKQSKYRNWKLFRKTEYKN